jgi:hypothetical protein
MKKNIWFVGCLIMVLTPNIIFGQSESNRFSDIQPDLESAIGKLSTYINIFDDIQAKMDASARANQNYGEQKNIFLSSQLAITTITAILEYNRDLLILFSDLKEKNRKKFYEVRIESLETSIKQINNMHKQIQINYTILPPDFFEQPVVNIERKIIISSAASLKKCVELLRSVNRK